MELINTKYLNYVGVWKSCNTFPVADNEIKRRIGYAKFCLVLNDILVKEIFKLKTRVVSLNGLVKSRHSYKCYTWQQTVLKYLNCQLYTNIFWYQVARRALRKWCLRVLANSNLLRTLWTGETKSERKIIPAKRKQSTWGSFNKSNN